MAGDRRHRLPGRSPDRLTGVRQGPQPDRVLLTVMFTDIVGYTALMQKDEARAAKVREHHRRVFQSCPVKKSI